MNTLGGSTQTIEVMDESYSLAYSFICDAASVKGAQVKLLTTGHVTLTTVGTEKAIGKIDVPAGAGELVTVGTNFRAIVKCTADGALAVGDEVFGSGVDATNKMPKYKKTVTAGHFAVGVVLEAGADASVGTAVIGLYRAPYVIPA